MNVLITAGGTMEKIDPVRKITNTATGKLGSLISNEFVKQGNNRIDKIFYICEKDAIIPNLPCVEVVSTAGANKVMDTLSNLLTVNKIDVVIHSMAVSDYTVDSITTVENLAEFIANKLNSLDWHDFKNESALAEHLANLIKTNDCLLDNSKKNSSNIENLMLMMKRTPKLIKLIKTLQSSTVLVGFKLLNGVCKQQLLEIGYKVLVENFCDLVLANDLSKICGDRHVGLLISPDKSFTMFKTKDEIAGGIVRQVFSLIEKKERQP